MTEGPSGAGQGSKGIDPTGGGEWHGAGQGSKGIDPTGGSEWHADPGGSSQGEGAGGFSVTRDFAPRSHDALIDLAIGDERLYRLPPVARGWMHVRAYHADVFTRPGPGPAPAAPAPQERAHRVATPAMARRIDDDGGPPVDDGGPPVGDGGGPGDGGGTALPRDNDSGGTHADMSPADNLQLDLLLGDQVVAAHGNHVMAASPNHTDAWRLRVRRVPIHDDDLRPNPAKFLIETGYTSQLPIIERRVPARFFHDAFGLNWNAQQYVYGAVNQSKVFINYREDFRQLYGLPREGEVIETDVPLVQANNIHTTSVTLDVGAGPSPGADGLAPFFSVRVDCAADGLIELPLVSDVRLPSFFVTVRLFLNRRGDGLEYVPVVESNLLDALADVDIPDPELTSPLHTVNAKDTAKTNIEEGIYGLQFPPHSGFSSFGDALLPWLVGERRQLWSIGYAPAANEAANGFAEPAAGDLLVRFVGPKPPRRKGGVLVDPTHPPQPPPPPDGAIRLYDLPDEEPDPEPDAQDDQGPFDGTGPLRPPRIGALAKVDHIVVLMMENRSFDQVLGYLSRDLGRTDVNGLNTLPPDPAQNPQFNRYNGRNYFPQHAQSTAWPSLTVPGPCHESECVASQMDSGMARFVASFAARVGDVPNALRLIMDYFDGGQLKVYDALAREFAICDAWFTAHAGPTWPNRFVLLSGDLNLDPNDNVEPDNPDFATLIPIHTPTLFDHLNDMGASWKVYENGYSFIRLFRNYTFDTTDVVWFGDPVRGFEATARAGALPQVTLIEPDYIDLPPGNDDHPPGDMARGQDFINRIVQALLASPQWEKTMFVITYDEHGGFYDHVQPPTDAPPLRGGRRTLGPRVPTFVISPWVKRGGVLSSRFDHTSIGATILRRFAGIKGAPSVNPRLDAARDLREALVLDTPRPRSDFASIGLPPLAANAPVARSAITERHTPIGLPEGKDDAHWLLSAVRLITGEAPR
jgi:phospholipase C